MRRTTIVSVVGARPQFVKLAPLCREVGRSGTVSHRIIHTGQHYDYAMSKVFFDELGIPAPDCDLEVGSESHGVQTGEMLRRIEEVLRKDPPDWVIVYGDTNSTLAGALAAAKIGIPVAHVEAGLRSYRKAMPEEINRVLTDHLSTLLLCPTENAAANLRKEGFSRFLDGGGLAERREREPAGTAMAASIDDPLVANAGDIMLDALRMCLELAVTRSVLLERLGLSPGEYRLVTVHRAENTDDPERLRAILGAISGSGETWLFPAHPRCRKAIRLHGISPGENVRVTEPVGYLDMLVLEKNARVIATDSGGVQKEAYLLGIPCVTLRDETEWVETLAGGKNRLAGSDRGRILTALAEAGKMKRFSPGGAFGRGDAASRILSLLEAIRIVGRPGGVDACG
ncbi:MAG: UDP-N-acetylglucosamine 2-epimerase (non-hydrolyzing) [Deltaproteobacteria bacterium]|nr:UDP-N-acetylglucosamine 2-epimerase (non-hydrolyzing) [Deltaproteobacteria bacterium]MBP2685185.1 UDP-N-acetylglucosamine 2-epimerase (non-hydrolyzing) [Deltaproteobacteria bacterium]